MLIAGLYADGETKLLKNQVKGPFGINAKSSRADLKIDGLEVTS